MRLPVWSRLAWAILAWGGACRELYGQQVAIAPEVLQALDRLSRDSVEHVACLYGETVPDTIKLLMYQVPPQSPIGTHSVRANTDGCFAALAHWHSHAVPPDSSGQNYLYYSFTDTRTFLTTSQAPVAMVGVPGIVCVWTRREVKAADDAHLIVLPSVPVHCLSYRRAS